MSEQIICAPESDEAMRSSDTGRLTVLEALAQPTLAIGPSRSNQSTRVQGDPDDQ